MAENVYTAMQQKQHNDRRKGLLDCSTPTEFLTLLLLSGGIIAALSISPAFLVPAVLFNRVRKDPRLERTTRSSYSYLTRQKLIEPRSDAHGNRRLALTKKGRMVALRHYTNKTFAERSRGKRHWDGQWRIFLFDIPAHESNKRDALRHFIKRLGMLQLQKSAWIYPYDCSRELGFIKELFELSDHEARLIVSNDIGNAEIFRDYFSLS